MNPITNSTLKEQIRQRNEAEAKNREAQIMAQLTNSVNSLTPKPSIKAGGWLIGGAILSIFLTPIAFVAAVVIWFLLNQQVKGYNENLDNSRRRLQDEANDQIRQVYAESDHRTQQEIAAYDRDVKMYAQKVMNRAESITPMVDHVVAMFQRMISHADAGAHMKFIEADFHYQVITTGIKYSYQSRYTNPQDDYNFNRERYRDLSSPAECEGLAQTLAKLVINKMKAIYPPNSINISLSHNDAQVVLHFKGANKNFVPARDIL